MARIATIECSTCSALLEIYPQDLPGEPKLGWNALDDGQLCRAPPLRRCPHARAEVKLRFQEFDGWGWAEDANLPHTGRSASP
jgi:hypothetical protein